MGIHKIPAPTGYRYAAPGEGNLRMYLDERRARAFRLASKAKGKYQDQAKGGSDFQGQTLNADDWTETGGTFTLGGDSGLIALTTAAVAANVALIDGGAATAFVTSLQRYPAMEFYLKLSQTTQTRIQIGWKNTNTGLEFGTDYVGFSNDAGASTVNWFAVADKAGVTTSLDLSVAAETAKYHTFRFHLDNTSKAAIFTIDGIARGTIASGNLPTSTLGMLPHASIRTANNAAKTFTLDYCFWWQDRPTS